MSEYVHLPSLPNAHSCKSGSRIPAGGFRFILQTNSQSIHHPLFQIRGYIQIESIVSIGPIASLLTVDIYTCMAHSSIKNQCCLLPLAKEGASKFSRYQPTPTKGSPPYVRHAPLPLSARLGQWRSTAYHYLYQKVHK